MRRLEVNESGEFSTSVLKKLITDIKKAADTSSEVIYVYPFVGKGMVNTKNVHTKVDILEGTKEVHKGIVKLSKWAVRIEGVKEPLKTNFKSKETAIRHAKKLQKQGQGSKIKVVTSL